MELVEEAKPTAEVQYSPTTTPILDVLRLVPSRSHRQLGAGSYFLISSSLMVLLIGLPAVRTLLGYWFIEQNALPGWVALGLAATAVSLAVAVHHTGHLLAARLAGFRLGWFQFGPWSLSGKASAVGTKASSFSDNAPQSSEPLRKRLMMAVLAGPLLGLVVAVLAEAMNSMIPAPFPARLSVHVFALASALLAVSSLLPDVSTRGDFSDGARLLMLLRKDALAERWLAIVELQRKLSQGENPRVWDPALVTRAVAVNDDTGDALMANWLAYHWSAEKQDISTATRYLEEALALMANAHVALRDQLFLEAGVFQGWFRSNPAKARYWAARISDAKKLPPLQRSRFDAAVLWAEGKLFEAWEKLGEGLAVLRRQPESPARNLAEKSLLDWKYQMESRMLTRAWRTMYSLAQDLEGADATPAGSPERQL